MCNISLDVTYKLVTALNTGFTVYLLQWNLCLVSIYRFDDRDACN